MIGSSYLTVEKWRIVVDIGNFNREWADTFETWLARICCFYSDTHKFPIFTFTIEDFVGENLASFFVYAELCSFLVGLLNNAVLDLIVNIIYFLSIIT